MCHNLNLALAGLGNSDRVPQVTNTALDFDFVMEKLFKRGDVEDLVADWLGAVDGELEETASATTM